VQVSAVPWEPRAGRGGGWGGPGARRGPAEGRRPAVRRGALSPAASRGPPLRGPSSRWLTCRVTVCPPSRRQTTGIHADSPPMSVFMFSGVLSDGHLLLFHRLLLAHTLNGCVSCKDEDRQEASTTSYVFGLHWHRIERARYPNFAFSSLYTG